MSISDVGYAERLIYACCAELGLQEDIKVIMVQNRWRWTLEFEQSKNHPNFVLNMLKLERLLQERTKRPIDLRLEAEQDKMNRKKRNVLNAKPSN